jgi:hypothetical protein
MNKDTTQLPNLGQVILSGLPKPKDNLPETPKTDAGKQAKPKADKQVKKTKKKK